MIIGKIQSDFLPLNHLYPLFVLVLNNRSQLGKQYSGYKVLLSPTTIFNYF